MVDTPENQMTINEILEAIKEAMGGSGKESNRRGLRTEEMVDRLPDVPRSTVERLRRQLVKEGVLRPRKIKIIGIHGGMSSGVEYVLSESYSIEELDS